MRTQIDSKLILDKTVNKDDIDITTPGKSLITKIIAGDNIQISSTGADEGTGEVTISANVESISPVTVFNSFVSLTSNKNVSTNSYYVVPFNKIIESNNNFYDRNQHYFDIPSTGFYFVSITLSFNYYLYNADLFLYDVHKHKRTQFFGVNGSFQSTLNNSLVFYFEEHSQIQIQVRLNNYNRTLQKNKCFAQLIKIL